MHVFEKAQNRTLVIVDMQDIFLDSVNSEMVEDICDLITHSRINEWGIILVELRRGGITTKAILDAVFDYEHLETVQKDKSNGGREVVDCLQSHPKWSLNILVCGVYGDACVPATVYGIFENNCLAEVDVVTDLVYPGYESHCNNDGGQPEREVEMVSLGL